VTQMLECWHMSGALAVIGCTGRLRIWDLAERVFARVPEIPADESRRIRSERLLGACGIMRDSIAVSPGGCTGSFPSVSPRPSRAPRVGGVSIPPGSGGHSRAERCCSHPSTDS